VLERAARAYYVDDRPEMSDAEYDRSSTSWKPSKRSTPTSRPRLSYPTRRRRALAAFKKHRHLVPMLSLDTRFDDAALAAWEERNARLAPEVTNAGYTLEVKIDGQPCADVPERCSGDRATRATASKARKSRPTSRPSGTCRSVVGVRLARSDGSPRGGLLRELRFLALNAEREAAG